MSGGKPSFVLRILKVTITSKDGTSLTFDGTPVSWNPFIPGFQITVNIENALLPQTGGTASVWIYGMTLDHMNKLSIAGGLWRINPQNKIDIYAGDSSSSNLTLIHSGPIIEAKPEFSGLPSTPFFISANSAIGVQMNNTVPPASINGSVSAYTLLQNICKKAGIGYTDHGGAAANATLSNFYTSGSAHDQITEVVQAAKIRGVYDVNGNLATFPQTGAISGTAPIISPANGMIGYPEFQSAVVLVRTIFDPSIVDIALGPGRSVLIQSQLAAANGNFTVTTMRYNLSCNDPSGGPWEINLTATNPSLSSSGS